MKIIECTIQPTREAIFYPKQCQNIVQTADSLGITEGKVTHNDKTIDLQSILGLMSLAPVSFDSKLYFKIVIPSIIPNNTVR
ncbi:MAG: HPr family phosphocarrier protein [Halanaerobiales bacterium]